MPNQFTRTELLFGNSAMEKLKNSKVAIFGIGGVGGYVAEALARSGVSNLVLIDDDKVAESNINRQIIATHSSIGKYKCDVMKDRILDINPDAKVEVHKCFFLPSNQDEFDFNSYDYVVDAVDTVTAKLAIIMKAKENNVPIISAMGAGNKLNPAMFEVTDIYKTSVDPLAKVMRTELKKRRVNKLKVVYSKERPLKPIVTESTSDFKSVENQLDTRSNPTRKDTPGSNAFTPSVMGLIIASEVIKDLTGVRNDVKGA